MTNTTRLIGGMSKAERRWHKYAECISELLGWQHCTGMPWDYIVCDRRTDKGGSLEMVHIDGHTAKEIRKQVAEIIRKRK